MAKRGAVEVAALLLPVSSPLHQLVWADFRAGIDPNIQLPSLPPLLPFNLGKNFSFNPFTAKLQTALGCSSKLETTATGGAWISWMDLGFVRELKAVWRAVEEETRDQEELIDNI